MLCGQCLFLPINLPIISKLLSLGLFAHH